jgi:hypothetical protein
MAKAVGLAVSTVQKIWRDRGLAPHPQAGIALIFQGVEKG